MRANDHSNGRWVRNLNEKLLRQVSTRVTREGSTDYNSILDQDLEALRENGNSGHPQTVDDQGYVLPWSRKKNQDSAGAESFLHGLVVY